MVSYRGSWLTRGPATPYGGHWRLDGSRGTIEFTFRGAFEEREKLDRVILHRPGEPPEAMPLPDMPCKDRKGALDAFAAGSATAAHPRREHRNRQPEQPRR